MFSPNVPEVRAGQRPSAGWLNRLREVALWASRIKAEPPLELVHDAAGPRIRLHDPILRWARVTDAPDGSGGHPWRGIFYDTDASDWADLPANVSDLSGVDPLYTADGVLIPVDTRLLMRREPKSGRWYPLGAVGGQLIGAVLTTNAAAATFTSTAVTPATCSARVIESDDTFGGSVSAYSYYPDAITAPVFAYLQFSGGKYRVITASCTTVTAPA